MAKRPDRQTVALPIEAMDKARQLSALASKHGWSALGVDREDLPTLSAILEEAINHFAARAKLSGRK